MNQSELIARIREESPYFAHGMDDESLWRVLQGRYEKLKDEPYRAPIIAPKNLEPKLNGFKWSERVSKWFDGWKHFEELKPMSDTESYKRILNFIHTKKSVSKKDILEHLNWGVRISFSEYRNRLRLEDTIKFTKNRYEVI